MQHRCNTTRADVPNSFNVGKSLIKPIPVAEVGALRSAYPSPIGFRFVRLRSQTRLSIKIHINSEPVNGGVKIRHIVECTPTGVQVDGLRLDYAVQRLQPFRHLHDCSGCFRLERWPGGTCTHWKSAALPRRTNHTGHSWHETHIIPTAPKFRGQGLDFFWIS